MGVFKLPVPIPLATPTRQRNPIGRVGGVTYSKCCHSSDLVLVVTAILLHMKCSVAMSIAFATISILCIATALPFYHNRFYNNALLQSCLCVIQVFCYTSVLLQHGSLVTVLCYNSYMLHQSNVTTVLCYTVYLPGLKGCKVLIWE